MDLVRGSQAFLLSFSFRRKVVGGGREASVVVNAALDLPIRRLKRRPCVSHRRAVNAAAAFPLHPVCLTRETVEEELYLFIYLFSVWNGSALVL